MVGVLVYVPAQPAFSRAPLPDGGVSVRQGRGETIGCALVVVQMAGKSAHTSPDIVGVGALLPAEIAACCVRGRSEVDMITTRFSVF